MTITEEILQTTPIIKIIPNYDVSENIFKSASYFKNNIHFSSDSICGLDMFFDRLVNGNSLTILSNKLPLNCIYLPFKENKITSIELPNTSNIELFTTDRLNGCALYICRNVNTNRIVVCHANSIVSGKKEIKNRNDLIQMSPSWQSADTEKALAQMMDDLRESYTTKGKLILLKSLYKQDYFKNIDAASNYFFNLRMIASNNASHFLGGSSVFGIRKNNKWSFYFQTYMNISNVDKKNFVPNFKIITFKKFFEE